jgi:HEAT repeats
VRTLAILFVTIAAFAQEQQPDVRNAKWESRAFTGDWGSTLRSSSPAWFGYAVKTIRKDSESCCWNGDGQGGCGLEGNWTAKSSSTRPNTPVPLEGSDTVAILLRVENDTVGKVHLYSLHCPLDAGGLPFVWLNGVSNHASITYLKTLAMRDSDRLADSAIFAIAQHAGPEADTALAELAKPIQGEHIREKVAFWLGASREAPGVTALKNMMASDPSPKVRDKAVFALSVSKQPEALDELIRVAKSDSSAHVRGQALFWLAQKAGKRAASTIQDAIENDPDTEVKKRAVFALSQLPKDESVPKLIEIARTQKNPEARKQAFFWLGQSQDPRALAFFQEVLSK